MPLTNDAAIERLATAMIACTLPKNEWTHEGHFAAALWIVRQRPDLAEPNAIRGLITRYNLSTDTPNTDSGGYHHTITLASMRAARDHLRGREGETLAGALSTLMASRLGDKDWPLTHWRRETLFSVDARREWVEPDLTPLPF